MEGQAQRLRGPSGFWGLEIRGASPHAGAYEKERGLVPGKTKAEGIVATHPSRSRSGQPKLTGPEVDALLANQVI